MSVFLKGTDSSGVDTVIAIETDGSVTANQGTDVNGIPQLNLDGYSKEIQTDTGVTFTAYAVPGTALATAAWRAEKVVDATGVRQFADGGAFSQVATDLTALTYAY